MNVKEVAESIAYCGLVCKFCHLADNCEGCKTDKNCCGDRVSECGCYQYNCCIERKLNGCWECDDFPCGKGMFGDDHDVRLRAFIRCAKVEGVEKLAEYVLRNQLNGVFYGHDKDYDNLGDEEAVLKLLRTGKK